MNTLLIVLGVVVVAIIAFFALRKPAELPPAEKREALPRPAESKRLEAKRAGAPEPAKGPEPAGRPAWDPRPPCRSRRWTSSPPPTRRRRSPRRRRRRPAPRGLLRGRRRRICSVCARVSRQRESGFVARLTAIFTGKKEIDPAILEQIEEVMLTSDVGVKTTQAILERLREALDRNELRDTDAVWARAARRGDAHPDAAAAESCVRRASPRSSSWWA